MVQSVRTVGAVTVEHNLDWNHMDVSTAFLNADIKEEVFVAQAPGFEVNDKDGGHEATQESLRPCSKPSELVPHH